MMLVLIKRSSTNFHSSTHRVFYLKIYRAGFTLVEAPVQRSTDGGPYGTKD